MNYAELKFNHSAFSKSLAPGLRLGRLAASEYVADQLALVKQRENLFTEGLSRSVVAELIPVDKIEEGIKRLAASLTSGREQDAPREESLMPLV
ncbi:MAG TPA: hypothetical protein VEZ40_18110 [Pyrinomonadaceae bacterium]|nr:hypothetical protein [Pyrinomonadaceae bacterium]